jgi:hypothetical protein
VTFFRKFFGNIVGVLDDKSLQSGYLRVICFLEIFGNYRKFSEINGKYCLSARRITSDSSIRVTFFRKFSKTIGKYCRVARRQITSDRFFKGDLFSEIFGNYRKFSEIIGKYCLSARRISAKRFLKGDFFSEIFGNYWKILLECETNHFRQFYKTDFFSEIFANYWKILSGC